ncbi:MAG: AAA family ATPase [Chitinophagaceae bacterium]|nr:AAA family ATPase [Chitinophagaceae bacterium]
MNKAFVFGKFLPFHQGHQAMIEFALTQCNKLTVLICASDHENLPAEERKNWLEKTFDQENQIEIQILNYKESELPNTSETSEEVSKIWAALFKSKFLDYDALITSEEYGNLVAKFMQIQHIPFDLSKQLFPISATLIREDLFTYWHYLPESVKPSFAIKIVMLGTESTGKTTLAEQLANHFTCSLVLEAGRELIPDSKDFNVQDLYLVATEHAKRIDKSVLANSPLIMIDTDIHITKSYGQFMFKKDIEISDDIYKSNRANIYLYLNNDVEFIQDGTRLSESERNLLDQSHRHVLQTHGIQFIEIQGSWNERFYKAVQEINQLIQANSRLDFRINE